MPLVFAQRHPTLRLVVVLLVNSVLLSFNAAAQQEHHLNSVSAFIGVTGEVRRDQAGTVGVEYERRIAERWVIAPAIEHAFGDLDFTVATLTLGYRLNKWAIFAGPGVEWSHDSPEGESGTDSEFLFRTGVLYEFEMGNLIVAPHGMLDFIGGDKVVVLGVTFGLGF